MRMSWDALLFDFDGVLADTEPIHHDCWRQILEPYGIQLHWDFYVKQCVGVSDRLMIERLASERTPPIPFEEIWPEYQRKQLMFQAFVCGREVANLKPAPDPYLRGAELLGASKPLVIEDSDAGVASARAAGFDVLRVTNAES